MSADQSLLDKSISIVILLLILSLISERVITWFKLYFFKEGRTLFWIFFNWNKDYSKKTDDPDFEKEREQRILLLNIILSVIIAFLARADLFLILSNASPYETLGWLDSAGNWKTEVRWENYLQTIFGCILGGFFISLGSKFWHDTLDLLLYSKNLKEKLKDKETYNVEKTEQLTEWLELTQSDMLTRVLQDNKPILKNMNNVISVGISVDAKKERYIEVLINNDDDHLIPKYFNYEMPNNRFYPVKVIVEKSSMANIHKQEVYVSQKISNQKNISNYGSFGCSVSFTNEANKPLLLTCYHVLKGANESYNFFNPQLDNTVVLDGDENKIIGKTIKAVRDHEIDIALVELQGDTLLFNELLGAGKINGIKIIDSSDVENKTGVYFKGAKTVEGKRGIIKSVYTDVLISYGNDEPTWQLYNLISVCDTEGKALTKKGDSGSAVIDNNNKLIGIVVAGNNERSYVMPIGTILTKLNLKLN